MYFVITGTEIVYRIYDPTIQKIDVLRLEKRLDNELFYLRDALPEYSTFPLDMEVEFLPEGSDVPVNDVKVPLSKYKLIICYCKSVLLLKA